MYISDLGWASIQGSWYKAEDDAWLSSRLHQISDQGPLSELISRWTFRTQNASKSSYLFHLMVRIASLICLPFFISRTLDYAWSRAQYIYFRWNGLVDVYTHRSKFTQLFLTLAAAEKRLSDQEIVDEKRCGKDGMRLCPKHQPVQPNILNRDLFDRAFQKTVTTLSIEDFKTLFVAIRMVPVAELIAPNLQKKFALEAIQRCSDLGFIRLPKKLLFTNQDIPVFTNARGRVDLNRAIFVDLSPENIAIIEELRRKSDRGIRTVFTPGTRALFNNS